MALTELEWKAMKMGSKPRKQPLERSHAPLVHTKRLVSLGHDETVVALRALVPDISLSALCQAFMAGVGGSVIRARTPLGSFARTMHLPAHSFEPFLGTEVCGICGLPKKTTLDAQRVLKNYYDGWAYGDSLECALLDLQDWQQHPAVVASKEDVATFERALSAIAKVSTPGHANKQLTGIVPKTHLGKRRQILDTLALVGVLPTERMKPLTEEFTTFKKRCEEMRHGAGPARSDYGAPLCFWHGSIDAERVKELFTGAGLSLQKPQ